jgi:hypothetical protein
MDEGFLMLRFFVVSFLLFASSCFADSIVVSRAGVLTTLDSKNYAVVKRSLLEEYRRLKRAKRSKRSRYEPKICPACPPPTPPPTPKNRLYLYGGINQGALSLNETLKADGSRDIQIFQRTVPVSGLGYARDIGPFSLSVTFLYQGIYLGGAGFAF